MGTDTTTVSGLEQPLDARRLLALIALADQLPMPELVSFIKGNIVGLHLHTLSDASRWATWLGATTTSTYVRTGGLVGFEHSDIMWHGWQVELYASQPATGDSLQLDAGLRAELEQVAAVTVDDTAGGV